MTHTDEEPICYRDLHPTMLIEHALQNHEGYLANNGAFCTATGARTGRSTQDRFIVKECSSRDSIDWGKVNLPFAEDKFDALWQRVEDHVFLKNHYISHLEVGDHPDHYIPVKLITETAWHTLFAHNILVCPQLFNSKGKETWRVLHAADFICCPERDGTHSDGAVIIHFAQRRILLAGMRYAGELKKSLFSVQNFLLPEKDVLPMHCAANVGEEDDVTLFFGLSGTGKTTLSADPERRLLGDDEHGWGKDTVFNMEGGCYAKTIDLSARYEPVIWQAIRFGAVLENVVHDEKNRQADYSDASLSENGRCCYPLTHVDQRISPARSSEPNYVIFLTCDVLGVLPPVAKLSPSAAAFHFLSGYTAKVGSTEMGSGDGVTPVFSACFGAPFMPRPPMVYARLLMKRITESGCEVYLVNTGWSGGSGGPSGTGKRFSIDTTRAVIRAIQGGQLKHSPYEPLLPLNLMIPTDIKGIDPALLDPRKSWSDSAAYQRKAQELAQLFTANIAQFEPEEEILAAGPKLRD